MSFISFNNSFESFHLIFLILRLYPNFLTILNKKQLKITSFNHTTKHAKALAYQGIS